jgi:hypothetical protein
MAQEIVVQQIGKRWRVDVPPDFTVDVMCVKSRGGIPRGIVTLQRADGANVHMNSFALSDSDERRRFVGKVNEKIKATAAEIDTAGLDKALMALGLKVAETAEAEEHDASSAKDSDRDGAGRPTLFEELTPYPETVDGADVLSRISALIAERVILPKHASDAIALWVAHTYAMDAWYFDPCLTIHSPLKRCGKSTLLNVVRALVYRPLATSNISGAALFRLIEKERPTLLMDEAQEWLTGKETNDLKSILQGGHTRDTAQVFRCIGEGGALDVAGFSTWAGKVIALVGSLPDMMMDRSIVIRMRRRRRAEAIEPIREQFWLDDMQPWREKLLRFAEDSRETFKGFVASASALPTVLTDDRAVNNWSPLMAIAEVAAGEWPARALAAAKALSGGPETSADSPGLKLIADIRAIFDDSAPVDEIGSAALVEALKKIEDRPWADWNRGKGITTAGVARLLDDFQIQPPVRIRMSGTGQQVRGYRRYWFEETWDTYLTTEADSKVSQCHSGNNGGPESAISGCHTADPVTHAKSAVSPTTTGVVTPVTLPRGPAGDLFRQPRRRRHPRG